MFELKRDNLVRHLTSCDPLPGQQSYREMRRIFFSYVEKNKEKEKEKFQLDSVFSYK